MTMMMMMRPLYLIVFALLLFTQAQQVFDHCDQESLLILQRNGHKECLEFVKDNVTSVSRIKYAYSLRDENLVRFCQRFVKEFL